MVNERQDLHENVLEMLKQHPMLPIRQTFIFRHIKRDILATNFVMRSEEGMLFVRHCDWSPHKYYYTTLHLKRGRVLIGDKQQLLRQLDKKKTCLR